MHTHKHTRTHTHTHTAYAHTHTCTHALTHTRAHSHTHVRARTHTHTLTPPPLPQEPTSGLDSSGAFSLLETVRELAHGQGRTVVASIHQPSSQMYHMFDDLMLLAKGKVALPSPSSPPPPTPSPKSSSSHIPIYYSAFFFSPPPPPPSSSHDPTSLRCAFQVAYYGPASKAMAYFSRSGLHCTLHYNPADYMRTSLPDWASLFLSSRPLSLSPILTPHSPFFHSALQWSW